MSRSTILTSRDWVEQPMPTSMLSSLAIRIFVSGESASES
jgi:hypothetical protein